MGSSQSLTSSELLLELEKLNTVGSVLFVAAHPDDENTALLTYLSQNEKLDTAYLSLTRGGGGQNLIGPELKEGLGLIRTNELLQARQIDGAKQLFTRARDFGYSKNPEDTLENWQEDEVLGDVVYAVRSYKPDVIITRFDPDLGRRTHGHHTVSAQLALKAFNLAADPNAFPEQLEQLGTHQAKRIYWNGYGRSSVGLDEEEREIIELEIGRYNPYLGTSYTEISAQSRSMHKSQGFGRAGRRGGQLERLVLLDGDAGDGDFLSGVDTTWARYAEGGEIDLLLSKVIEQFDHSAPWKSVPDLLKLDPIFQKLPLSRETEAKRKNLHEIIAAAMGLHIEARSSTAYLTPGQKSDLQVELNNRSPIRAIVRSVQARLFDSGAWPELTELAGVDGMNETLRSDVSENVALQLKLSENVALTQPYWLEKEPSSGLYYFDNDRLLELHDIPTAIEVVSEIEIEGQLIELRTPAIQVVSDPVKGEVHFPVSIRPEFVLHADASVLVFQDGTPKEIDLTLTSNVDDFNGTLQMEVSKDWVVDIENAAVSIPQKETSQVVTVKVTPPAGASEANVTFSVLSDSGKRFDLDSKNIEYEHIGRHAILSQAKTKLVRLDLARAGNKIACIEGVGDTVPDTLERIGYDVDRIEIPNITTTDLQKYDTVILGPRAFDAHVGLDRAFEFLTAYVKNGGTLISQFNTTSFRSKSKFSSPYPIQLSRDRVSEEKVEMRILKAEHPVFNTPNKITKSDFDDWIQERGLYYASSWDDKYDALVSANDRGESPKDGGLLVAQYGKGWYAYTGLSFFRQLPEGNSGAIRLFVNLISLGHEN
ncbi:PIG-L family deacetylase [Puniceicoccaceae bacterium K14]|nr:PIG-L family deacetylase [Puniceicoccaceae bacterium K14]